LSKKKGDFVILQYDELTDRYSRFSPSRFKTVPEAKADIEVWAKDNPGLLETLSVAHIVYAIDMVKYWHTWCKPKCVTPCLDHPSSTSSESEESTPTLEPQSQQS